VTDEQAQELDGMAQDKGVLIERHGDRFLIYCNNTDKLISGGRYQYPIVKKLLQNILP